MQFIVFAVGSVCDAAWEIQTITVTPPDPYLRCICCVSDLMRYTQQTPHLSRLAPSHTLALCVYKHLLVRGQLDSTLSFDIVPFMEINHSLGVFDCSARYNNGLHMQFVYSGGARLPQPRAAKCINTAELI